MSAIRVAFAGPCASGKSSIAHYLRDLGVDARMPAQEHSGIPDMWRQLLSPDYLIVLDAPNEVLRRRRPDVALEDWLLDRQRERLAHARANADLVLDTGPLTVDEVRDRVRDWLMARGVAVGES